MVGYIFFFLMIRRPPRSTLFPTRRSSDLVDGAKQANPENSEADYYSFRLTGDSPAVTLGTDGDRKSTRLNSSHLVISYAVFCLKKKKKCMLRLPCPEYLASLQSTRCK